VLYNQTRLVGTVKHNVVVLRLLEQFSLSRTKNQLVDSACKNIYPLKNGIIDAILPNVCHLYGKTIAVYYENVLAVHGNARP
jgi:hypothetical protein